MQFHFQLCRTKTQEAAAGRAVTTDPGMFSPSSPLSYCLVSLLRTPSWADVGMLALCPDYLYLQTPTAPGLRLLQALGSTGSSGSSSTGWGTRQYLPLGVSGNTSTASHLLPVSSCDRDLPLITE